MREREYSASCGFAFSKRDKVSRRAKLMVSGGLPIDILNSSKAGKEKKRKNRNGEAIDQNVHGYLHASCLLSFKQRRRNNVKSTGRFRFRFADSFPCSTSCFHEYSHRTIFLPRELRPTFVALVRVHLLYYTLGVLIKVYSFCTENCCLIPSIEIFFLNKAIHAFD